MYSKMSCMFLVVVLLVSIPAGIVFGQPAISLDRDYIGFGSGPLGVPSPYQTILIENSGSGNLNWSASPTVGWLDVSPSSGTNAGLINVSVDPVGLPPGKHWGDVDIIDPLASNNPQHVSVELNVYDATDGPFGSFDTPLDGSTVHSSVPVTGWALDDIGVESVKIYNGNDYLGDAVFIEGPRPDVEQAYPGYPNNYKAGWGYMMLTNFLPNGGNGTYFISARATDLEGNEFTLGTKTIICDNANAVKPFGAIDTPVPGGIASGDQFINWGWALTPPPHQIPMDGSTIDVFIDGVYMGHPVYNVYSQYIADQFPGYANSNGAAAYFTFDCTAYTNGVHTIQWTARDESGSTDGIGSRYFTILNTDNPTLSVNNTNVNLGADQSGIHSGNQSVWVDNIGQGDANWAASTGQNWIICDPLSGTNSGTLDISVDPSELAPGTHTGTVYISASNAGNSPQTVDVTLNKYGPGADQPPFGEFASPADNTVVQNSIPVTGWVLDDIGVESVKVYRNDQGTLHYLGDAVRVEGARPDVAAAYPRYPDNTRAGWGFMLLTNFLPRGGNGEYSLEVIATDVTGKQTTLGSRTIIGNNASAVKPFGAIDSPAWGEAASGHFYGIHGWALTYHPNIIPRDGSTIDLFIDGVNIGHPVYNQHRADVEALFPGYQNSDGAGFYFHLDTRDYADGLHTLSWRARDNAGNKAEKASDTDEMTGNVLFIIQNDHPLTGVNDSDTQTMLPAEIELSPAYPNPFNPETRIVYRIAERGRVRLSVYDILGRHVRTLVDNRLQEPGSHVAEWRGSDASGNAVSSGVYVIILRAGTTVRSQKIILLR